MNIQQLALSIIKELVDSPHSALVLDTVSNGGKTIVLTVRTEKNDMGKVIGKNGKNIVALRTILEAVATKNKQRVIIEIDSEKDHYA